MLRTTCRVRGTSIVNMEKSSRNLYVVTATVVKNKKTRSRLVSLPVVRLGQLVGHGQDGQGTVLFRPKEVIDSPPVDEAPPSDLDKHLAEQLLVVLAVQLEGLRGKRSSQEEAACLPPYSEDPHRRHQIDQHYIVIILQQTEENELFRCLV